MISGFYTKAIDMENTCIVLGDEHQNVLEGLRGLLETQFGSVVMVADRQSLFQALDRINPKIAAVDLSLIGQNNADSIGELNKKYPNTRFIILSNYDEPNVVDAVISSGAAGYVIKQYAGKDLLDAIKHVKQGQPFISPAVDIKRKKKEQP